jgi:cytochrome c oxidase assembly protein subunit 15
MRWSYNLERSYAAAIWLGGVALLVVLMVIVGGATRLTGSGLSITEWKPVTGVIPPLSAHGWAVEFDKYRRIPQYALVNRGIALSDFKTLYWWEWGHRLLARLVGAAILIPFAVLLYMRRIPRRLVWRCGVVLGLVALEGLIGWWMVASGLEARIYVAPERLATHLCTALLIFSVCVWTALEAWFGRSRASFGADRRFIVGSGVLLGLVFFQIMMGALVAGNQAGRIYTDWPLMAGRIVPKDYAPRGAHLWDVLAHSQAAVQFNHRIGAYILFLFAWTFAIAVGRAPRVPTQMKQAALVLAGVVTLQALLGVLTVIYAAPFWLALIHQIGAVALLTSALVLAWRVQRN